MLDGPIVLREAKPLCPHCVIELSRMTPAVSCKVNSTISQWQRRIYSDPKSQSRKQILRPTLALDMFYQGSWPLYTIQAMSTQSTYYDGRGSHPIPPHHLTSHPTHRRPYTFDISAIQEDLNRYRPPAFHYSSKLVLDVNSVPLTSLM